MSIRTPGNAGTSVFATLRAVATAAGVAILGLAALVAGAVMLLVAGVVFGLLLLVARLVALFARPSRANRSGPLAPPAYPSAWDETIVVIPKNDIPASPGDSPESDIRRRA